jgi:hypothetical protein
MRPRNYVLFSVFLLVAGLIFISATCDSGPSSGTLTVGITGNPPGTDNKILHMGLFEGNADPLSASILAVGDIELSVEFSEVMKDPVTSVNVELDGGNYDLYAWIDMNDNIDTVQEPEQGIDMSYVTFPFPVSIDGDTTVNLTSNNFEIFPGF